ncbi:MAG: exoribonuclease II, partial [Deltaproteobacteria bacterium]|nr:exoribonuclease II [Deltaproteobacteria bacterium]
MQPGTVVEFIDRKNIISAVVLEQKYHKVRMLTMHNREISHAEKRLAHVSDEHFDLSVGRTHLVERLHSITAKRKQLQNQIDLKELWQVLHTEPAWIDVQTMAEFCFDGGISSDHMSAVMRAVFEDRLYFKFDTYRFFPNSPEKVAQITAQVEEEAKKTRIIDEGTHWIRQTIEGKHNYIPSD